MSPHLIARVAAALSARPLEEPAQASEVKAQPKSLPEWKRKERELKQRLRPRIVLGMGPRPPQLGEAEGERCRRNINRSAGKGGR